MQVFHTRAMVELENKFPEKPNDFLILSELDSRPLERMVHLVLTALNNKPLLRG